MADEMRFARLYGRSREQRVAGRTGELASRQTKKLGIDGLFVLTGITPQAQVIASDDDFVICCRATAAPAMVAMREMMQRLRLTVNEQKTRQCRAWDESFEFLGYTIGV